MNYEHLINSIKQKLHFESSIFTSPNIPSAKLNNAIGSYGRNIPKNEILVLLDDTLFGSAKDGLMISKNYLFIKAFLEQPVMFHFNDINTLKMHGKVIHINNIPICNFTTTTKSISTLIDILNEALELNGSGSLKSNHLDTTENKRPILSNKEISQPYDISSYKIPNSNYKDSFIALTSNKFINSIEHHEHIPTELKVFYRNIIKLACVFPQGYAKHQSYNQSLDKFYQSDEVMLFCLLYINIIITRILDENEFEQSVIDNVMFMLNEYVESLVEFIDYDHFNKLSSKGNPQKALDTSPMVANVKIWSNSIYSSLKSIENPLEQNRFYEDLPYHLIFGLIDQYPELLKFLSDIGLSSNGTDHPYLTYYLKFSSQKIETYLNQLF